MDNQDQNKAQQTDGPINSTQDLQVSPIKSISNQAKAKWKFIGIVGLVAVILAVGGILLLKTLESSPVEQQVSVTRINVLPEDQQCVIDADCVRVGTACSDCSCGEAVNKIYQQKYQQEYTTLCKNYHGPVCEFYCETQYPRCINSRCVLSAERSATDTSDWQTYRNEEFEFEVKYPKDWINTTDKERNTIFDEQDNPIELKHYEFSNKKGGLYDEYDANVAVFQIDINDDIKFFERIQKLKVNEKSGKLPNIVYTKIEDFTINGYPAVRYVGDYSAVPAGVLPRGEEVLLRKGNNVFHFMLIGEFGGTVEGYKNIFNQILATFRFVEK